MKLSIFFQFIILVFFSVSCTSKTGYNLSGNVRHGSDTFGIEYNDSIKYDTVIEDIEDYIFYANSVKGHVEEDVTTGNFTGQGIDTLSVISQMVNPEDISEGFIFFAKSNNPDLPLVELFSTKFDSPKLVFEGDVDGDGKDEWGYLQIWDTSQWAYL